MQVYATEVRSISVSNAHGGKFSLPTIAGAKLRSFDLYTNEPNPGISVEHAVFCLIGANGLGKSTFLDTLNFAITGS